MSERHVNLSELSRNEYLSIANLGAHRNGLILKNLNLVANRAEVGLESTQHGLHGGQDGVAGLDMRIEVLQLRPLRNICNKDESKKEAKPIRTKI